MHVGSCTVGEVLKATPVADPVITKALQSLSAEHTALTNAGFTDAAIQNALTQDYMESGAYSNTGAKNNNPGNNVYSKNDPYASKGPAMPDNPGYFWATYKSMADYAKAKKRILQMAPGNPYAADNYADFAHGLKLNNYYGKESEASYLQKLTGAAQRLRIIADLQEDSAQDVVTDYGVKKDHWYDFFTKLPVLAQVGLGLAALLAIRSFMRD